MKKTAESKINCIHLYIIDHSQIHSGLWEAHLQYHGYVIWRKSKKEMSRTSLFPYYWYHFRTQMHPKIKQCKPFFRPLLNVVLLSVSTVLVKLTHQILYAMLVNDILISILAKAQWYPQFCQVLKFLYSNTLQQQSASHDGKSIARYL